jgi:endonuclease YncB( thermonuclease family)
LIPLFQRLLGVVNRTDQGEFAKFTLPSSRTHGIAERALDCRENGFTHCSLPVSGPIDPRIVRVIDGPELTRFDQGSHAIFAEFLT